MGADRAVLLSDRVFAGSDTLATARVLAEGVRKIGNFDLICCGNFTVDGSTAQVPSQVAELLGIPNVMHVSVMEYQQLARPCSLPSRSNTDIRVLEGEAPLLLSFIKEANKPRYVSFLEMLEAEKREIAIWSNEDLGVDESLIGLDGSPTKMADILLRKKKREGLRLEGSPEEIAQQLADKMYQTGDPVMAERSDTAGKCGCLPSSGAGVLHDVGLELLSKARELADQTGGSVSALLLGHDIGGLTETLLSHGADRVFVADDPRLEPYRMMPYLSILGQRLP